MHIRRSNPGRFTTLWVWPAALLFVVVFLASLLGIWTRSAGFVASMWPANALMLGILLRVPGASRWSGWLAGALAFMAADLLTETELFKAVILNAANMIGISAAYLLLSRLPAEVQRLRHPLSMLYIVLVALCGGVAAGVIGGLANPLLFGGEVLRGFFFWCVTESVNYLAILPILLSAPALQEWGRWRRLLDGGVRKGDVWPALAVLLSCGAAFYIGGPGAIVFPMLALLWCGLVYPVFPTAILTLACCMFVLLVMSGGAFAEYVAGLDRMSLISIRLGVGVIAIAPIMLSIVTSHRNELLAELRYLSAHDSLTGVSNRAAFLAEAQRVLGEGRGPYAVMMLDIDLFKSINDSYGHAAGDEVLREVARRIRAGLRPDDRLGRLGGEEFAVLLAACPAVAANEVAERIRRSVAEQPVFIRADLSVPVALSIGVACGAGSPASTLDSLLADADAALYVGKNGGRNRVVLAGEATAA